jgi:hypothetical protein
MKIKFFFFCLLIIFATACLPGTSLSKNETSTAQIITATTEPTPNVTPIPVPPTLTPPPTQSAGLDRVNIYLVAIGDNGASGKLIGCGDSLIPVVIQIEPTMGVLRAALNELFKLEGQSDYAGSGLYNALYLSHLEIDDVAVVGGEAIIKLKGSLVTGGECDIPRIEEQLQAIALQFSTVDSVTITVNGTPLDELLDLRG